MADENKEQETIEGKTKKKIKCILLKNVKYGNTPYKAGEKIQIKEEDFEEFKKVGAIKIE